MIPLETIAEGVASAKLYYIDLLNALLVELGKGCKVDACKLQELQGLIRALTYDINDEVNDDTTQELYVKLLKDIDGYSASYVIDPNVVYPYYPVGSVETEWGKIFGDILDQADLIAYIASQIGGALPLISSQVVPTAFDGTVYFVTVPELGVGISVDFACKSGAPFYTIGDTVSEEDKKATYDPNTKRIYFPVPFYPTEFVWCQFRNS